MMQSSADLTMGTVRRSAVSAWGVGQCSVRLRLNHGLDVNICDDGVGLPEGWRAGVGIASMRERVTELGGDLVIEPSLPHGTRINARLPAREKP